MTIADLTGNGTPEAEWRPRITALGDLHLAVPVSGRVVVVAPHPDDEVLGAGAAMRLLALAGAHVTVVAVTDGEASHPRSPTMTADSLAERRPAERMLALSRLGLADAPVVRLQVPDGEVGKHERWLARELRRHVGEEDLCLAPWQGDGHPDHDSAGGAAVAAARETGCALLSFPIWLWHWADPTDPNLPWHRMRRLRLDSECVARKRKAVTAFVTQTHSLSQHPADRAVLPEPVLRRLTQEHEVFLP